MIKRPLNPRFSQAVLDGRKITTIRDKPWPIGVPIMLYNWSGLPYRSKQVDVAPIIVEFVQGIDISHEPMGAMFSTAYVAKRPLFGTEGFGSHREMEQWFEAIIKPGQTVTKQLMRFRLLNDLAMTAPHQTPIPDNVLPALVISDLLAVGFKLEPSTGRFWHWAESPGIELIEGKWFPCDMFDNGDMQYSDDGYESPVEAAKQAVQFFS